MGPRVFLLLLLVVNLVCLPSYPHAQKGSIGDVRVEDVAFRKGEIHGVLRNNASHRVRDVELLIRYFWVWKANSRAREKGPELPFRYTVRQEIPPHGSIPFSYATPPLPSRDDGYYDLQVTVVRSVNVDTMPAPVSTKGSGKSPDLKSRQDVARIVGIERLQVKGPVISGMLRNKAPHRIRDVELLIRHVWVPNNEYQPSQEDLGKSTYQTVRGEIQPGGSIPFAYDASPLASRSDGQFETKVKVAGFEEMIGPGRVAPDRNAPQIRLGRLVRPEGQGQDAAKLEAIVEDPAGIQVVEVWLNGVKATGGELLIEAGNRERIQFTRTFALPRFGENCVAIGATDRQGNSSVSKEVCLYREPVAAGGQRRVAPQIPKRTSTSRPTVPPGIATQDTRGKPDRVGPRIELLRPNQRENIGVGSVRFEAILDDQSGIANADVWLNDQQVPSSGIGVEQRGQKRIVVKHIIPVSRMGINCFGLRARDLKGNASKERVCLVTRRQAVPGQASPKVRSLSEVTEGKAAPPVTAPPKIDPARPLRREQVVDPTHDRPPAHTKSVSKPQGVTAAEKGQLISMDKKIAVLKQHYLEERITAQQFDRAVRTLESGKRDRMLEDFLNGEISVATFRRAF